VSVAGQMSSRSFGSAPNQSYGYLWDGNDGFGRPTQGPQPVTVRIGYDYPAQPLAPSDNPLLTNPDYDQEFGHYTFFGVPASTNDTRTTITLWHEWHGTVGHWNAGQESAASGQENLGGWTLSVHHVYDPSTQTLYYGDGRQRTTDTLPRVVTAFAGQDFDDNVRRRP
jgi:hypothetical protein